jgi:hypothetical protein
MPYHSPGDSKDLMAKKTKELVKTIKSNKPWTSIGPNHKYIEHDDKTIYFHTSPSILGTRVHSISVVGPTHNQEYVAKGPAGSAKNISRSMAYHIYRHNELHSDVFHTSGSKKLWTNFIKDSPDIKFTHSSQYQKPRLVNAANIHKEDLWGDNIKLNDKHRIHATRL